MSATAQHRRVRRWLGLTSHLLLAWLAALVVADLVALRQPPAPSRDAVASLSPGAPLPNVAPTLWGGDAEPTRGLRETRLPLTLIGGFRAEPPGRSLVVVGTPDGQVVAGPGDPLMDGVRLERIDAQGLILDNDGRRERLNAPDDDTTTGIRRLDTP